MKKILSLLAILISMQVYCQNIYVKALPTYFISKTTKPAVGILGAAGVQLNRYAKAGIGGGYYKIQGYGKGFGLVGLDLNVCDFSKNKILPFIHTSAYYPIYKNTVRYGEVDYVSKGSFQIQFSGGVSLPVGKARMLISGGISDLLYTTTVTSPVSKNKERTVIHMFVLSVGALL